MGIVRKPVVRPFDIDGKREGPLAKNCTQTPNILHRAGLKYLVWPRTNPEQTRGSCALRNEPFATHTMRWLVSFGGEGNRHVRRRITPMPWPRLQESHGPSDTSQNVCCWDRRRQGTGPPLPSLSGLPLVLRGKTYQTFARRDPVRPLTFPNDQEFSRRKVLSVLLPSFTIGTALWSSGLGKPKTESNLLHLLDSNKYSKVRRDPTLHSKPPLLSRARWPISAWLVGCPRRSTRTYPNSKSGPLSTLWRSRILHVLGAREPHQHFESYMNLLSGQACSSDERFGISR